MKPSEYQVEPQTGRYIVRRHNGTGYVARAVTKNKQCSCGGDKSKPCAHINAVAYYLLDGGQRAKDWKRIYPDEVKQDEHVTVCPICETVVRSANSRAYPLMWRCPADSSHYWAWHGERHNIKRFFEEHRTGIPAIDAMTTEEYCEYLDELEKRGPHAAYAKLR